MTQDVFGPDRKLTVHSGYYQEVAARAQGRSLISRVRAALLPEHGKDLRPFPAEFVEAGTQNFVIVRARLDRMMSHVASVVFHKELNAGTRRGLRHTLQGNLFPLGLLGARGSHGRHDMPAKSAAQQKAAGAALSAKRGDTPKSELKGAARDMEESMTEKELEDFASTKRKGKPEHVKKS